MLVKCLAVGPMLANCYLVWCEETKEALVIDPGGMENVQFNLFTYTDLFTFTQQHVSAGVAHRNPYINRKV